MSMMYIESPFGWPSQQRGYYRQQPRANYMYPCATVYPESFFERPQYGRRQKQYQLNDYMDEDSYEMHRQRQRAMQAERKKREREEAMRHRARIEQQRELELQRLQQQREREMQQRVEQMQLNQTARKLQRWFRTQAQHKRQDNAARTIQNFFASQLLKQKAQHELRVLRAKNALKHVQEQTDALKAEYRKRCLTGPLNDDKGRVRRDILAYEEYLTKLMLEIDHIPTHGDAEVRAIRKATVTYIQQLLRELDSYRSGTLKVSRALKRGGPKYMPPADSSSDKDAMEH